MLLDAGYEVFGTTRSKEKAKTLEALGVSPVVLDVYDYATLEKNSFRDKTRACLSSTYRLARWLRRREDERCTWE